MILSCNQGNNRVKIINENTFEVDFDNEKIMLAVNEAQENLDVFITEIQKHSKDTNYWFSAKKQFDSPEKIEHFWLEIKEFKNNVFTGILLDEPRWTKDVKAGDTIFIRKKDIEDWFISNESLDIEKGNFTEKHLFENEQ